MKLIIRQYLSSLRERDELDVILPDLLSQLGLNVFSRPGRGTRQDGVDVGAVGSLDGGSEKVYLFSVKPGNLTRRSWDGDSLQSLRSSLNEIIDSYIPNRLPTEHCSKNIVICIGIGGDVQEQVRSQLTGFINQNTTEKITFEEWNGDKLASLIQSCFLREDLLPKYARSYLRKSLALLDEPEASYQQFAALITSLGDIDNDKDAEQVMALRQMSICLWILFGWAREAENMEAAYLSSELTLLFGWKILSLQAERKGKITQAVELAFVSMFSAYQQICGEFLLTNVFPHAGKLHALSSAVRTSCSLDVNLKLFDLLGRLATFGIWAQWIAFQSAVEGTDVKQQSRQAVIQTMSSMKSLILTNPVLLLPVQDDQAIGVSMAIFLLMLDANNHDFVKQWLAEVLKRASFAYQVHGQYPCNLRSYSKLLSHPNKGDITYRKEVTNGSILYPLISLCAAILNDEETYNYVADFKKAYLQHCNFQFWYPDEFSETHFYTNSEFHGAVLSNVCVDRSRGDFLEQVFGECDETPYFKEMSAVKFNWWPLVIVGCRHYRLPLPLHFLQELYMKTHQSGIGRHA